jgi:hypothetical protein
MICGRGVLEAVRCELVEDNQSVLKCGRLR